MQGKTTLHNRGTDRLLADIAAHEPITLELSPVSGGEWRVRITTGWCAGRSLDTVNIGGNTNDLRRAYHLADDGIRVSDDGMPGESGYPTGTMGFVRAALALGCRVVVNDHEEPDQARRTEGATAARFTPEPWVYDKDTGEVFACDGKEYDDIAVVSERNREANLHLICTAHALYAACKAASALLEGVAAEEERNGKRNAAMNVRNVERDILAALAKVEGRGQ